ncbi:MAG: group II intron maturase-specific domain-containing protein [Ignavibacteriaceae bacterium]
MKMQAMNEWLREIRCRLSPEEIWKVMKVKLIGHYRYYGVSGNYRMIAKYNYNAIRELFYWLNRRSQRRNINWECFRKYLKKYPLPSPKISVNLYTLAAHK